MPAEVIQVQYDTLVDIAGRFGQQAELTSYQETQIRQRMHALHNGGWQGRGAFAFFTEVENEALPAMQRLSAALSEAQTVTEEIIQILREAEEDGARSFKQAGDSLDNVSSGNESGNDEEHKSIWNLPTAGKDLLTIWDTGAIFEKIPDLGVLGPYLRLFLELGIIRIKIG